MVDVIGEYTDYGFMEGELTANMEVVLVLRRKTEQPAKPQHDLLTFTHKVEQDFSKLFIYNAVWNNLEKGKGMILCTFCTVTRVSSLTDVYISSEFYRVYSLQSQLVKKENLKSSWDLNLNSGEMLLPIEHLTGVEKTRV